MKVLENFDRALGRRVASAGEPLRLLPHAFRGANAYFDPKLNAVLFGYFPRRPRATRARTYLGSRLHLPVARHHRPRGDARRRRIGCASTSSSRRTTTSSRSTRRSPTSSRSSSTSRSRRCCATRSRRPRGDLARAGDACRASPRSSATRPGRAGLRTALDGRARPARYDGTSEPHERGSILVAAVFEASSRSTRRGSRDLIRIATGGTGVLPEGELHPDLVDQLAREAAARRSGVLTMCIRAFDYLPPVDVTFSDYLRALVTADHDLVADEARRSAGDDRGLPPPRHLSRGRHLALGGVAALAGAEVDDGDACDGASPTSVTGRGRSWQARRAGAGQPERGAADGARGAAARLGDRRTPRRSSWTGAADPRRTASTPATGWRRRRAGRRGRRPVHAEGETTGRRAPRRAAAPRRRHRGRRRRRRRALCHRQAAGRAQRGERQLAHVHARDPTTPDRRGGCRERLRSGAPGARSARLHRGRPADARRDRRRRPHVQRRLRRRVPDPLPGRRRPRRVLVDCGSHFSAGATADDRRGGERDIDDAPTTTAAAPRRRRGRTATRTTSPASASHSGTTSRWARSGCRGPSTRRTGRPPASGSAERAGARLDARRSPLGRGRRPELAQMLALISLTNAQAMATLHGGFAGAPAAVPAGEPAVAPAPDRRGCPASRVHVMGPVARPRGHPRHGPARGPRFLALDRARRRRRSAPFAPRRQWDVAIGDGRGEGPA